jgi:N-carbamoylputrescine amidase
MKIALIQQHATKDKYANVARGLAALETAARNGAQLACFAELAFEWFYPQRPAGADFRELAESIEARRCTAFQKKAKELGIVP